MRFTSRVDTLVPLFISILAHQVIVGSERLNPRNITWLANGGWDDAWGHYIGWETYRNSPWTLPLGLNQNYGIDLPNSVVYTDSIPFLAIFFKLLSPIIGDQFQYFGLWLLLCFILHGIVSWRIIKVFTNNLIVLIPGTLLLCFTPSFLNRLNTHMALSGHFLLLVAIFLVISRDQNRFFWKWFLLLVFTSGVHAYLLLINLCLFIAITLEKIFKEKSGRTLIFIKAGLILLSLTVTMWQYGYFVITESLAQPFSPRLFKVDLLQPLNFSGWSWLGSFFFPVQQGNYDAFNYLGFATILIIAILLTKPHTFQTITLLIGKKPSLFFTALILTFISLSNTITFNRFVILSFEYPKLIEPAIYSFRAIGRFFWMPSYLIIFLSLYLFTRYLDIHKRATLFRFTLAILVFFQISDSSFGWRAISEIATRPSSKAVPRISESDWRILSTRYSSIVVRPSIPAELNCDWQKVGYISSRFKLATNCIYAGRTSPSAVASSQANFDRALRLGSINPKVLYLTGDYSNEALLKLYAQNKISFLEVDGLLFFTRARS